MPGAPGPEEGPPDVLGLFAQLGAHVLRERAAVPEEGARVRVAAHDAPVALRVYDEDAGGPNQEEVDVAEVAMLDAEEERAPLVRERREGPLEGPLPLLANPPLRG